MSYRMSGATLKRRQQVTDLQGNRHTLPDDYPIPIAALTRFLQELFGTAVFPGDPDYDRDRAVFNSAYSATPRLIVYCICIGDVRASLRLVRDHGLTVVVRSGGHSMAGFSVCDGVVIDVSGMNSVVVSPESRTMVVGPGTDFAKLNANLDSFGLHVPGGGCSTVCVAGYMQGGGYGFTSRLYGMNSDNVVSFRMVLADGSLVTANPNQNQDLFWAVRGGTGGQFGVLVEIVYKLHPIGEVRGVRLDWSVTSHLEGAASALQVLQNEFILGDALPGLGLQILIGVDPSRSPGLRVSVRAMYAGSDADLQRGLASLRAIPGCEEFEPLHGRYATVNEQLLLMIPPLPGNTGTPPAPDQPAVSALTQSVYIARRLSHEDWRCILEAMQDPPNDWTAAALEAYGGEINRIGASESAFIHRDVVGDFFADVFWVEGDREKNVAWHRKFMKFMAQFGNGHSYQNYPNRDQTDWAWAYFGPYLPTLVWVKAKYDPTRLFDYGQAIPAETGNEHAGEYADILFTDPVIVRDLS